MTEIERAIETLKNSNKMLKNHMDETMDFIHTYADSRDDYNFDNVYSTIDYCEKEYRAVEIAIAALTEQAERDGRCVVLPCKVGDTVWVDTRTFKYGDRNGKSYAEGLITSFVFGHRNFVKFHIFSPYVNQNNVFKYPLSAFGKTVFLTPEAAQAALRKEQ